jgi:hypothetical protein
MERYDDWERDIALYVILRERMMHPGGALDDYARRYIDVNGNAPVHGVIYGWRNLPGRVRGPEDDFLAMCNGAVSPLF